MSAERKPRGYWNFFNTLCEVVSVMRKNNLEEMPSEGTLTRLKKTDLQAAIYKNGGFPKFREALHQDQLTEKFGDDPAAHYQEHHAGVTRGKLYNVNRRLYGQLLKKGLLHIVKRANAKPQDFGKDPLVYYHEHYPGITRGQLQKQNRSLYGKLCRARLINNVPRQVRKPGDFGKDPLEFYKRHYAELTRGQLQKKNRSLYRKLRRDGLIEHVPSDDKKPSKEILESMLDDYIGDDDE